MRKPRSLTAFQKTFSDEAACADFLFDQRWPDGFACPACGDDRAVVLKSRAWTYQCVGCRRLRRGDQDESVASIKMRMPLGGNAGRA